MILYIRQGCHLCETFVEEMNAHNGNWLVQLKVIDVDDSEQTAREYGEWVPVVVINEQPVCRYFFDPEVLSPYFQDSK